MGYKRPEKHYRLTFAEPEDMAGFEVIMRRMSSDEFLTLTGLASDGIASSGSQTTEAGKELFAMLGTAVVSWNLEDDDGAPVAPSAAALLALDWEFVTRLTGAYLDAAAGVAPPLPAGSNGGGRFPEVSIPMETLSPSRTS